MIGISKPPSFWRWLFIGNGSGEGWKNLASRWLLLDLFVGLVFGVALHINLVEAAKSVLFPLASIFVGMAIAWASNSHSLLKTPEFSELCRRVEGGLVEYVYPFMLGMLTLISTLVLWAVVAMDINVSLIQGELRTWSRGIIGFIMFCLLSLNVRTSWGMVNLVLNLLIFSEFIKTVSERAKH